MAVVAVCNQNVVSNVKKEKKRNRAPMGYHDAIILLWVLTLAARLFLLLQGALVVSVMPRAVKSSY